MFMQNIRRATKKHRKVLLVVVVLLMFGLVGSFATWSSRSGLGGIGGGAEAGGEYTLDQYIAAYLDYIRSMEEEANDYSSFLSLASSYIELGYLYMEKLYDNDVDEEAAAAAEEAMKASAAWARIYYQRALDDAPEGLNVAAIADIMNGQAEACEMQGDSESAVAYRKEANSLQVTASLSNIESLKAEAVDYEGCISLAAAYMELSYLYADSLSSEEEEDEAMHEALSASAASAREYFQQALDVAPEGLLNEAAIAEVKFGQAEACNIAGDSEGALDYLEEANSINPDDVRIIYSIAMLNQELGRDDEAFIFYQRARTMAPEDMNIVDAYSRFLFSYISPERGIKELQDYRDALPEGHPYIETADNNIANLQGWADLFSSLQVVDEDDEFGLEIDREITETEGGETAGEDATSQE